MSIQSAAYSCLAIAIAAWIGISGWLNPINNWDIIGYIASGFAGSGLTGTALHDATYGDLRHALLPQRFAILTQNGPYAMGVFRDPAALDQQLPFYRIRVLYVVLLQALAPLTDGIARATYLVSALSASGLTLLTAMLLRHRALPLPLAVVALVAILYLAAVPQLARLSTPDALFGLGALAALSLFYRNRGTALLLVAVLVLVRTDAFVLAALLLALMLVEHDRAPLHYGAIVATGALYLWVNAAHGNYGHSVLFNFSLIPGQRTPYPASLDVVRDPAVYLDIYRAQAASMLTRWVPYVLLIAGIAVAAEHKSTGHIGPQARLVLVSIGYVLLHFLAFPLGESRHYSFALILCGLYVVHRLAAKPARPAG